ncbi:MAG TPA: FtsQ-type POTRA domain-containing protein [Thermoanaerobaculia bacterium]|nr:FtsQ-type POTRA domain-containing protein [Thermoanaerobaculia bacterium]
MSGRLAFGGGIALAGGVAIAGGGVAGGADLPGLSRMAMAGAAAGRVLDFRRRGAPPRRRRRSPLLALARPLAVAAATVALPLALGAWLLTSRQFQLRTIAVGRRAAAAPIAAVLAAKAAERVPAAWVRQALAPLLGRNLLRLPLAEVRLRLAANPWVAAAEVAKELPDRLRVTVAERRPAVLLRSGDTLLYADAAGLPIAPVGPPAAVAAARRQGLLMVSFQPAGEALPATAEAAGVAGALQLAARLRQLRPAWTPALSQIDVVDEDDYRLHVEALPCPLLVRGSRLADNLIRFEQLLPELRRRYPALTAVDLRFSRRIVVQPAPRSKANP